MYKLSVHLIEEMRMIKAKDQLCFMAANLRVEEKDLETIIRLGIVTERWLYWKFICDAVVAVLAQSASGKCYWKQHKVEYFKREANTGSRIDAIVKRVLKG